jgi:hypothetical protein
VIGDADKVKIEKSVKPISTQEKFPRTENFPKMSLLKVEIFQLQNFFPTENLCQPIKLYKIFLSGNEPLKSVWNKFFLGADH